ncbi:MAG: prevent-host-death protein [Planctomycetes bacterium]|nr:prevent-host-death protein [Planctomycetota bacterium]
MLVVGVKTLKDKLSEYLRFVARGELILVTDRDRVVAELGPPRPGRTPEVADAVLADAVRKGWITPAAFPPSGAPPGRPVGKRKEILRELAEDRGDR